MPCFPFVEMLLQPFLSCYCACVLCSRSSISLLAFDYFPCTTRALVSLPRLSLTQLLPVPALTVRVMCAGLGWRWVFPRSHPLAKLLHRIPMSFPHRCFSMSKSWAGKGPTLKQVTFLFICNKIRSRHVSCYNYIALFSSFLALTCFNKWKTSFLALRFDQFNWIFPTVVRASSSSKKKIKNIFENSNSSIICFVLCVTGAII